MSNVKPPKAYRLRGERRADVANWQSCASGMKVCSIQDLDLFSRQDFERFEKWLAKAKACAIHALSRYGGKE